MWSKPDPARWQGRLDSEEVGDVRRWHQQVRCERTANGVGIALLGFACDAGVKRNHGRPGAHKGPQVIRQALANLAWHGADKTVLDAGDVVCEGNDLEAAQAELAVMVDSLLAEGHFPIVLGGGHEIAFGTFSGLARYLGNYHQVPHIGIINLDAHFDLRLAREANSGTPFRQIAESCEAHGWPFHYACFGVAEPSNTEALFARAHELGVSYRLDEDMGVAQLLPTLQQLQQFIAKVDHIYLTIDIDVLPAYQAPGVSAPAARGVALEVVEAIVDMVKASGKLRVADLAELNPEFDIDHRTAKTAARLVYRLSK
ncbi:formimidoylglutamase [Chitinivorax sp. B]|uniref:formimidoylglutamase n=1 Tax=Chitinivorax sp. B TaxID=2502235 RepID=UPI0010F4E43C|nr:formimidoylglutamase [Chitinivorax sp. B]